MQADQPSPDEIFAEALRRPEVSERANYLAEVLGHNEPARQRMERLLRAYANAHSFLDTPAKDPMPTVDRGVEEAPGTIIGPYKLLQQIGEGGMGVVFVAEQDRPVRRRVALKVIKPGMDTREVIARFEAERQALAMMDHPNIAKVLDAGIVGQAFQPDTNDRSDTSQAGKPDLPSGRPYFVMELVQGVPITEYCDQCNLTTRERLELFVTVCQAVQHAHQKGIIHRDIKPTNVLVAIQDGQPAPKIIDFGVAKAIGQQLTEHTLMTAFAQIVGTPLYMSPEQAELSPLGVDTRSDIYSLGVLLYELLTGSTPLDKERLHAASYDELRRIIREEEPPRPSARISTLAADLATTVSERRRTDARRLRQTVRGELDWIVMKALEKDRNRRYESAGSLAGDIERYLHDEPVQACPPSASYRFKKFIRRNKVAAVFILLLAAGVAALAVSNVMIQSALTQKNAALADKDTALELAQQNEQRATTESARAKAVSDFLLEMILSPSGGGRIKGRQYTVREMLDDYAAGLGNQVTGQPEVEAELRHAFAYSYVMLGLPERGEPHLKRAIELLRTLDSPQTVSLPDGLHNYGATLFLQRRYDEAEARLREALEIYHQRGVRGSKPITSCKILQQVLAAAGRHDEAERAIDQAWAEMQDYDELPPEFAQAPWADVAGNCCSFACYFARIDKHQEAAEFLRRGTLAQQRLRKPLYSLGALQYVASARLRLGDEAGYREACRVLAEPPVRITNKDFDQADEFNKQADEYNQGRLWVCCLGPDAVDDPSVLVKQAEKFAAHNSMQAPYIDLDLLGAAHFRAGHFGQAAQFFEQSIAQSPSERPPSHGPILGTKLRLAMTKWQLGEHDDARHLLREIQPEIGKYLETPALHWQDPAAIELLRREAEALIEPREADEAVENEGEINDE
jgi:serine/threonine protein kinase